MSLLSAGSLPRGLSKPPISAEMHPEWIGIIHTDLSADPSPFPDCGADLTEPVHEHDHAAGDPDAPVTLVEYGNYSCCRCAEAHPVVEALRRRFGDKLRVIFRHVFTPQTLRSSQLAAEAAEAAAAEGKFWAMHKRLLEAQHLLEPSFLTWPAAAVGLNLDAFQREMNLRIFEPKVSGDAARARTAGVHDTPTFFINGRRYDGPVEIQAFSRAIERAMP